MNNNTFLNIQDLTKKYRDIHALNKIDLKFDQNGCYGILGANGAGKTTLLLIITKLIKKFSGQCKLEQDQMNYFGFLPENWGNYSFLSPIEHLDLLYKLRTQTKPERKELYSLLKWVGIEEKFWEKNPKTYSKGMKQRLGIAIAFSASPKIVILDEPLAHIDPMGRQYFLREFQKYKMKNDAIIVMSSHVISEIEQIADHITIIDHGEILTSNSFLEISLKNNNYEYDIVSISSNQDFLKEFYNILDRNRDDLKITDSRLTKGKILINSKFPCEIQKYLHEKSTDLYVKPTAGFLGKFYADILGDI